MNLELPEIESLRREIEREFVTRKIKAVEIKSMKSMPNHRNKKEFEQPLVGSKVEAVERYGMHLALRLNNGYVFTIRLGEKGSLSKGSKLKGKDLIMAISFTQGGDLNIADTDDTNIIGIALDEDLDESIYDPAATGIDLQNEPLSWVDFGRLVKSHDMPLKLLITDPTIFIGIGDIYSNEILYEAGLKYDRSSSGLSTQEVRRLYRAMVGVIHEATKYSGTSLEDRPFVNLNGEPGEFASQLQVYGKDGDLSARSRTPIKKTRFKNQAVYYCDTQV